MEAFYYWLGFCVFWFWLGTIVIFGAISMISEWRDYRTLRQLRSYTRSN